MRTFLFVVLAVLLIVPGWSGPTRLQLIDRDARLRATMLALPADMRRIGRLEIIGAMLLTSDARAFGGFSAISVRGGRATLLSDGGNWISFGLRRGRTVAARSGFLEAGPGTGWIKSERDSESLAVDPASGAMIVGFERANEIWRYAPGFTRAERWTRPPLMRGWSGNGGAETLARLADGRFLAIREGRDRGARARPAVLFDRDPTAPGARAAPLTYLPPQGYSPSDAAMLPNGDLLVLNRRFTAPYRFSAMLGIVPAAAIRPGGVLRPRIVARLAEAPLAENWEGVAVTREGAATILWLISDEDVGALQRTILLKARLR